MNFIKQYRLIIGIAGVLILIVAAGWAADWWQTKQKLVKSGLASPTFPFRKYTLEELNKLYPEYPQANIPDRQTPEETYTILRQALINEDINLAIEQFVPGKKEIYQKAFEEDKSKKMLSQLGRDLPEEFKVSSKTDIHTIFLIRKRNDPYGYSISFVKDLDGKWKVDSF